MYIRIKNMHDIAIKSFFTGNTTEYDKMERHNKHIISDTLKRIYTGAWDICYTITGELVYVYTRSSRIDGVQKTSFWLKDGEWLALSHEDIKPTDFNTHAMQAGVYSIE